MKDPLKALLLFFIIIPVIHPSGIFAQSGSLDGTFGEKGIVTVNTDPWEWVSDMIIQPDGRILIATSHELWRFDEDGNWDETFGNQGIVIPDPGTEVWLNDIFYTRGNRILVTGKLAGQNSDDLFLMRLNQDGTSDPEFSADGKLTYGFRENTFETGIRVVELPDGTILTGGNISNLFLYTDQYAPVFLLKFSSDGILDDSFGNGGVAFQDTLGFGVEMYDMELMNDGKILMAGYAYLIKEDGGNEDFWLYRINADGSRDTSFGMNGSAILDMMQPNDSARDSNTQDIILDIENQSDGKVIALGRKFYITGQNFIPGLNNIVYDTYEMVMARFNSDGSLDRNFGDQGIVEGPIHFQNNYHLYYSMQIDEEDRILVGHPSKFGKTDPDFVVSRYLKDGQLDESFGFRGSAYLNYPGSEAVKVIKIRQDRMLAAGSLDSFGLPDREDGIRIVKYITEGEPLAFPGKPAWPVEPLVYPVPFNDGLFIRLNSTAKKVNIKIFNLQGRVYLDHSFIETSEMLLNTAELKPGIYFIQVDTDERPFILRALKME